MSIPVAVRFMFQSRQRWHSVCVDGPGSFSELGSLTQLCFVQGREDKSPLPLKHLT